MSKRSAALIAGSLADDIESVDSLVRKISSELSIPGEQLKLMKAEIEKVGLPAAAVRLQEQMLRRQYGTGPSPRRQGMPDMEFQGLWVADPNKDTLEVPPELAAEYTGTTVEELRGRMIISRESARNLIALGFAPSSWSSPDRSYFTERSIPRTLNYLDLKRAQEFQSDRKRADLERQKMDQIDRLEQQLRAMKKEAGVELATVQTSAPTTQVDVELVDTTVGRRIIVK